MNAVASAVGHVAVDGDELKDTQGKVGAVGALHGKVGHERRRVPWDRNVTWHQEVDNDIDVISAVASGHGAYELKAGQMLPLVVALLQERLDKLRILSISQGFRIQTQIYVQGSDMWHIGFAQQQPGIGTIDHGELALVASEDLTDLDQHRLDGDRGAVVIVGGVLRLCFSHGKNSPAKCSAASRSRSLPFQRSRLVTIGLVQNTFGPGSLASSNRLSSVGTCRTTFAPLAAVVSFNLSLSTSAPSSSA